MIIRKRFQLWGFASIAVLILFASSCNDVKIDRVIVNNRPIALSDSSPIELLPGAKADLAIDVKMGVNDTILWSKERGEFQGATDKSSVTYVAPINYEGPARVLCRIISDGKEQTITLPIVIVKQSGGQPIASQPGTTAKQPESGTSVTAAEIEAYDIERGSYIPSGWMGDGEKYRIENGKNIPIFVNVDPQSTEQPHKGRTCQKWSYKPGPSSWAAVGWQYPENNWGDKPGKDLRGRGFSQVTVWARGLPDKEGNLPVVQFKAGGNTDPTKPYKASFEAATDFITLTADWRQYSVTVKGNDLSMVISAFTWVMRAKDNPNGATFYLSEIEYR